MGTGARRNPPPLHERVRDLGRVDISHVERHDRRARRLVKRTVKYNAGDFASAGEETFGECAFVSCNRLHPALCLDKIKACGKARYAVTVERARLEPRGPLHGL